MALSMPYFFYTIFLEFSLMSGRLLFYLFLSSSLCCRSLSSDLLRFWTKSVCFCKKAYILDWLLPDWLTFRLFRSARLLPIDISLLFFDGFLDGYTLIGSMLMMLLECEFNGLLLLFSAFLFISNWNALLSKLSLGLFLLILSSVDYA